MPGGRAGSAPWSRRGRPAVILGWLRVREVPTVAESGLPGFEAIVWNAVFAPAGTPAGIIGKLNAGIGAALRLPEVAGRLRELGSEPSSVPPEAVGRRFASDFETWGRVIRDLGLRSE